MSDLTFAEAAERAGRTEGTLRKHAQRGKLRTTKTDAGVMIAEQALEAYLTGEQLVETGRAVQRTGELGNIIANLPQNVRDAILNGMPKTGRSGLTAGDPTAFPKAIKGLPKREVVDETSDDPHFGHPVGYQHKASPRWKRVNASTWELDGATWSHNGIMWVGGGLREGKELDEGISPAAPASDRRPLAPSTPVKR